MEFIFFVLIPVVGGFVTLGLGFLLGLVALVAAPAAVIGLGYVVFRIVQWLVQLIAQ
ncbi:MAG: hypothetical protein FWE40_06620 [Oscillospiraceae bacterium]|nr:hypothetical protein [Oscillospiraceae bacterium]